MEAIGVLCMQIDAAFLVKSSLEHEWPDIKQNAVECFYSLEYIEAIFSFTEEIIDKVKTVGCFLWDSSGCCLGSSMQSIQQNAV